MQPLPAVANDYMPGRRFSTLTVLWPAPKMNKDSSVNLIESYSGVGEIGSGNKLVVFTSIGGLFKLVEFTSIGGLFKLVEFTSIGGLCKLVVFTSIGGLLGFTSTGLETTKRGDGPTKEAQSRQRCGWTLFKGTFQEMRQEAQ